MKLIFCKHCSDTVKLDKTKRYCKCGKCYGWYEEDGLHAHVNGTSVVLGIDNRQLAQAIKYRFEENGYTREFLGFDAFIIIPEICKTVNVLPKRKFIKDLTCYVCGKNLQTDGNYIWCPDHKCKSNNGPSCDVQRLSDKTISRYEIYEED